MWTREEGDEDTRETMGQRGAAKRADSNDTRVLKATKAQASAAAKKHGRFKKSANQRQAQIAIGLDSNRDEGKLRKKTLRPGARAGGRAPPKDRRGLQRARPTLLRSTGGP